MTMPMPLRPRAARPGQRGFTLIELMISITVGLVILSALVVVLSANSGEAQSNDRTSELQTNGRFALNNLKQELRQAGYRGFTWAEPSAPGALGLPTSSLARACFESGSSYEAFVANLRQGIWGSNGSNPFAANCIPATRFAAGNDVLVLRRVAGAPVGALQADAVYFHSSYAVGQMFKGSTAPNFGTISPLADFQVQIYVYYISPYTLSANESPLVPALRRLALDANANMVDELVASGIEHLQLRFARQETNATTRYFNANDIAGSSTDSHETSTTYGWDDVISVELALLARNATPEPGYSNTQTYTLGDASYTKSDGLRRQLFSSVVQLRN